MKPWTIQYLHAVLYAPTASIHAIAKMGCRTEANEFDLPLLENCCRCGNRIVLRYL